jgi:NAD(P)-dependent dehydrogenase (short-subunit alcohol dehydrogenase family)
MERVLITGAAGGIGQRLRADLAGVYPLLRLSDRVAPAPAGPGEELVVADLADLTACEAMCVGIDGVVHLGLLYAVLHFWTDVAEYYEATLELMASVTKLSGPLPVVESPAEHDLDYRTHFERRERPEYFRLNQEIHNAIVRAAGNPTLAMLHGILRARMRRIRYIGNQAPEHWSAAMAEHEAFINALRARDGDALARLLRQHLENTWPRVSSVIPAPDRGV